MTFSISPVASTLRATIRHCTPSLRLAPAFLLVLSGCSSGPAGPLASGEPIGSTAGNTTTIPATVVGTNNAGMSAVPVAGSTASGAGTSAGGVNGGGMSAGGMSGGGVSAGGMNASGMNAGGMSTGGMSTGGMSTGGMSAGGMSTGGVSAGGMSTGGTGGEGGSGGSVGGGEARSDGCGATRALMNGRRTIQSGGTNREYILRVPDDYDNEHPYRLVFAFHWLNGNADQVANGGGSTEDPFYGLWDLAEGSTIFVAPEGLDAGWANSGGRDLALTDAILAELLGDLCIDTTRIFATGFSYGAGMSYAIACARADVFRGVALYAGAQLSGCDGGTTPIAYLHVHGVGDSVLGISGGRQLRDNYVQVNGCTPQSPQDPGQNSGTHTCTSYEGCMEGYPVRWCAHGGDHNPTEKDSGQNESWVPGEAWTFISQF